MRCAQVDRIIEHYVDGRLGGEPARELDEHARTCARCAARIEEARRLAAALKGAPALRAPEGFSARVMDAVYREALAGPRPREAVGAAGRALVAGPLRERAGVPGGGALRPAAGRVYSRLGASFVLTAAVLAAVILVPRAAGILPGLPSRTALETAARDPAAVKSVMEGAGSVVRSALYPRGRLAFDGQRTEARN